VLRPGGLIFLAEIDFHIYDGNRQRFNVDTKVLGPPWCARWMEFANVAITQGGGEAEVSSNLVRWVNEHHSFENIVHQEYWIPASPWAQGTDPESIRQTSIGERTCKELTVRFLQVFHFCLPIAKA
jgi:hypothetical protein